MSKCNCGRERRIAMFSFEYCQAFAKRIAFQEISDFIGIELGEVQFDIPSADVHILRGILDVKGYDPRTETLYMIKPIYGLKDAPRA